MKAKATSESPKARSRTAKGRSLKRVVRHKFVVEVEALGGRRRAELALLTSFATRHPDGCSFYLKSRTHTNVSKNAAATQKRCNLCGHDAFVPNDPS